MTLYDLVEPLATGLLDVGDGNHIYWESAGSPQGKPAVVLHGGPGEGAGPGMRRGFDPSRYLTVLLDQRGCGRSTPNVSDPAIDLSTNTTAHLVQDLERLREHLGIDRWLVCGGSWGATLGLAYAEVHPDRVTEIVLTSITTSRRSETDWLYRGAAIFFPEAFERFKAAVPDARDDHDLLRAYSDVLKDQDLEVRAQAAREWAAWETAILSLEPGAAGKSFGGSDPVDDLIAMVRLCAWYGQHGAFLEEGALIRDANRLVGLPGVLIHGRLDLSCPVASVWELARAWPDARLMIDDHAGHRGSELKRQWLLDALDGFAT